MLTKIGANHYMATGNATRDPDFKFVGENQTPLTKFAIAAGKKQDGATRYIDCQAWGDLALYMATALRKGTPVCIIGTNEEREHKGKTYNTLNAEWANVAALPTSQSAPTPEAAIAHQDMVEQQGFEELNDAQLPF